MLASPTPVSELLPSNLQYSIDYIDYVKSIASKSLYYARHISAELGCLVSLQLRYF